MKTLPEQNFSLDLFPRSLKLMVAIKFFHSKYYECFTQTPIISSPYMVMHFANGCRARSAPSVYKKTKINNDDIV